MNCTAFNLTPSSPFFPEKNSRLIARTRTHDFGFTGKRLKRCRMVAMATSLELELPLLPFSLNEVLVPSESKTLHLYEARYLGLLEESLMRKNKLFVHFVLDPIIVENSTEEASFAARNGCLVFIENVERLEVGALVSIRGIGRVKIVKFVQAPKEAQLQTRIANSLMWTEKELLLHCNEAFFPSLAERVSFAALQPISGSTESELLKLQQEKLRAMDLRDSFQRLDNSLEFVKDNISRVAAKLAIQSVEMQ
ncbi:hypothetical protein PRUPE_1G555700 [Prunus persica]|uniref:Lon N-terminal domain-containing protein n=1 Tax=Prunus persica TaxID=3760 RepID=A0A251RJ40_PRUPE|nr:hypothetical protein PRUPE_1G555700 [Prunus persica]